MSFSNINRQSVRGGLESQNIYSKENTPINTATTARTEGNSLQDLAPGKVFAGEIVSVGKEKVTLKLDNGQLIQASSNTDVQLKEGQLLAFLVKSNTGKQLAIKPMFDVTLQSPSVLKALENAGIPVSAKSTELINWLMQEQMPIDRDTVTRFLRQMNLNPEVQVKLLVDLQKMGQAVTGENITKFQGYQNHQYPLATDVTNLASHISESIAQGAAREDNQGVKTFLQMADIFLPAEQEAVLPIQQETALPIRQETALPIQQETALPIQQETALPVQQKTALLAEQKLQTVPVSTETKPLPQEVWMGAVSEVTTDLHNLSAVQRADLNVISQVEERFQGQNLAMENVLEGLKVLTEEADALLGELQDAIGTETPKPEQNDMITKLYAAFERYERSEKAIQEAKDAVASKHEILNQEGEKQPKAETVSRDTLSGILDQTSRNYVAQKIYKITGNIRQYFQVRTGEMKPEELVKLLKEHLPKEELLAEQGTGKTQHMSEPISTENVTIPERNSGNGENTVSARQLKEFTLQGQPEEKGTPDIPQQALSAQNPKEQKVSFQEQQHMNTTFPDGQTDTNVRTQELSKNVQTQEFAENGQQNPNMKNIPSEFNTQSQKMPEKQQSDSQAGEKSTFPQNMEGEEQKNNLTKNQFQQEIAQKQLEKLPEVKELLQSKEFKSVLRAAIENQMFLKPEELTKEKVKDYYEKMEQQLQKLTELAEQTTRQDNPILKNTDAIRQNVDYINQLNQIYSYVQLPLKLSNQNTNSELYVLTNKRRMREHEGAFTALLHLDMERLGGMDVYLTMEEKKVAARFYLEHEGIALFLKENSQPLLEKLKEKGFQFTVEFTKKPKDRNLVEEFTHGNPEQVAGNKYSFDIRM